MAMVAAAVKRFANYRRFEVVLCQLRSSLKKPSRLSSRLAARVSTYKLLTLYHQHSNASRCLGEHMHDALDGPAARRAAVAEQLGARLAHAHVHARHDRMVLGRVEAHHAHRLLRIGVRLQRVHARVGSSVVPPAAPHPDAEETQCVVCMDAPRNRVVLPCMHMCVCEACAQLLRDRCPVCRGPIERIAQLFT